LTPSAPFPPQGSGTPLFSKENGTMLLPLSPPRFSFFPLKELPADMDPVVSPFPFLSSPERRGLSEKAEIEALFFPFHQVAFCFLFFLSFWSLVWLITFCSSLRRE